MLGLFMHLYTVYTLEHPVAFVGGVDLFIPRELSSVYPLKKNGIGLII